MRHHAALLLSASLALLGLASILSDDAVAASTDGEWTPGLFDDDGFDGATTVIRRLDIGDGLVTFVGGQFEMAGSTACRNVARWTADGWRPLGAGLDGTVRALAAFDDGNGPALFAGGEFLRSGSGGPRLNGMSRWDGVSWRPLGTGMNGDVRALFVHDDGSGPALYAGGRFTSAGGVPVLNVARWDGAAWSALPGEIIDHEVRDFATFDGGTGPALYAGGDCGDGVSPSATPNLVRWDGRGWAPVATTRGYSYDIDALLVHDDGSGPRLFVGGSFTEIGGVRSRGIARFDGTAWSSVAPESLVGHVLDMAVFDGGTGVVDLFVAGSLIASPPAREVMLARWDGAAWHDAVRRTPGDGIAWALGQVDLGSGPRLVAGGGFKAIGPDTARGFALWDGAAWSGLNGTGLGFAVQAMAAFDDGRGNAARLVVGGGARLVDTGVSDVRAWDGRKWSVFGVPFDRGVGELEVLDIGAGPTLFAGGAFTRSGNESTLGVARWDGAAWRGLGAGLIGTVHALAAFDDGSERALYAGGAFSPDPASSPVRFIAKWNGSAWVDVGSGLDAVVNDLQVFDDGSGPELWACGEFLASGSTPLSRVARFAQGAWRPVGAGLPDRVYALAVHDDGGGPAMYASGLFGTRVGSIRSVAKWNGTTWEQVGQLVGSAPEVLASFDDGTGPALYAGGYFGRFDGPLRYLARWDGESWRTLGGGTDDAVLSFLPFVDEAGPALYVGGAFDEAGGVRSHSLARWSRPTASPYLGTVGARTGAVEDVLFVNDSNRRNRPAPLATYEPITVFVAAPSGTRTPAPFALYATSGRPPCGEAYELPFGIGTTCLPMPLAAGADPSAIRAVWNNTGRSILGAATMPSTRAPSIVLRARRGARRPLTFTLQGIVADGRSRARVRASVTNAVTVQVR